jgi:penicillin-insensitive murein endopeptidase
VPYVLAILVLLSQAVLGQEEPSLSVGHPWSGRQEGARNICAHEGPLLHAYSCARGLGWGTEGLVDLLVDVAHTLQGQYPDVKLVVGNLGRRNGGEIPFSVSHQSGRDADVAFVMFDRKGNQVLPLPLVHIRGKYLDGRDEGQYARFDPERSWAVARAFIADPRVQWVFVADPLKEAMLDWARAHNEDPATLIRAEFVLKQPSTSTPHDDHFHVRLYCDDDSRMAGCLDRPPLWSWADSRSEAFEEHVSEQVRAWGTGEDALRLDALTRLTRYERADLASQVIEAWPFEDAALARAARDYLARVDLSAVAARLLDRALALLPTGGGLDLLAAARDLPTHLVDRFLERAVTTEGLPAPARLAVLRVARGAGGPAPLHALADNWRPFGADERRALLDSARFVLNRSFKSVEALTAFLDDHEHDDGNDLLLTSLPGICVNDRLVLPRVAEQILRGGMRRTTAVRILERMFGASFSVQYSNDRMYQRWITLIGNHPELFRLPCEWKEIRRVLEGASDQGEKPVPGASG